MSWDLIAVCIYTKKAVKMYVLVFKSLKI